jgi:hypothetical protein
MRGVTSGLVPFALCAASELSPLLKSNRVSGVGISGDLVVQRKDRSVDSHTTSVPDWPRASLSRSFAVILLV